MARLPRDRDGAVRLLDRDPDRGVERAASNGNPVGKTATLGTTAAQGHRHDVEIYSDGTGRALSTNEHEHAITSRQVGGETVYELSGPQGMFRARVPQYGKLRFLDRQGRRSGPRHQRRQRMDLSQLHRRRHAGGRHLDLQRHRRIGAAIGRPRAQVLPLELIVRVFRTYKGDIETGIQGSLQLRNPDTKLKSDLWTFTAKDASINHFDLPRKLDDADQNPIDLINDLVTQGRPRWKSSCSASTGPILWLRAAGLLHPSAGWLAAVEFCQGADQHLDADGAGDRHRRDLQHAGERRRWP